jgi:hypothetical protein
LKLEVHIAGHKIAEDLDADANIDIDMAVVMLTPPSSLMVRQRTMPPMPVMPSNSLRHCCKTVSIPEMFYLNLLH